MKKEEVLAKIREIGIMPGIRTSSAEDGRFAAEAIAKGGIPIVEITMTVPNAIDVISDMVRNAPNLIVGAGTVLDLETARRCLDAGVGFLTSPGLDLKIVEFAVKENILMIAGAMTPTEVITAWKAGSELVKVFPCAPIGGPSLHKSAERAISAGADDRRWRRQPGDGCRLHSGRSSCTWNRWTINTESCHRTSGARSHQRTGKAVLANRADRAQQTLARELVLRAAEVTSQSVFCSSVFQLCVRYGLALRDAEVLDVPE